ncbi:MAG: hypothetical protein LBQ54_10615 [Planctomycetaceae bacterium]|nr:hypothetical protein [Planctomycetaceae bacterium]
MRKCWTLLFCLLILYGMIPVSLGNTPSITDSFDSEFPTWEILTLDPFAKVTSQKRVSKEARSGLCESVTIQSRDEGTVFLGHTIAYPCLIEDLQPTLWVKSDHLEICAAIQVALPETLNPETDEPYTILLPGARYQKFGEWEQLRFNRKNLYTIFNQQLIALRLELQANIKPNKAYVRRIVLFTSVHPGENTIAMDDLEVSGVVALSSDEMSVYERNSDFSPRNLKWFVQNYGIPGSLPPVYNQSGDVAAADVENWLKNPPQKEPPLGYLTPKDRKFILQTAATVPTVPQQTPSQTKPIAHLTQFSQSDLPQDTVSAHGSVVVGVPGGTPPMTPYNAEGFGTPFGLADLETERRKALLQPLGQDIRTAPQILTIDRLPKSIRAIEYRGEPLDFLAMLQFNTVWLASVPSEAFLNDAWKVGLWVICPVPGLNELQAHIQNQGNPAGPLVHLFRNDRNPILAWNLGSNFTVSDYERLQNLLKGIQFADRRKCPMICNVESGLGIFSENIDMMLLENSPLFSSLDFLDYQQWLKIQTRLAKLRTTNWCAIQTQPSPYIWSQWKQFGLEETASIAPVSIDQIRMQIHSALAAECHGFLFRSQTPLNAQNAETEYRAAVLELINWEMFLQDGWYSLGKLVAVVGSSDPVMSAIITQAERSLLLLPMVNYPNGQCVMGESVRNNVRFIVPGSLETYSSQLLIPGGARPIYPQRKAGGIEIQMEEAGLATPVFFAQSETVLQGVLPRTRQILLSRQAAELSIRAAQLRLQNDKAVMEKFRKLRATTGIPTLSLDNKPMIDLSEQNTLLRETERAIETAKSFLQQNDYGSACLQAERSVRGLQIYERSTWEQATRNFAENKMLPVTFPTAVTFATLPYYISTAQKMADTQLGQNRLSGGECENLAQWIQLKWERFELPQNSPALQSLQSMTPLYSTRAVFSPQAAKTGNSGLHLAIVPQPELEQAVKESLQLETAPIWITSPPVGVNAGELLCIHGYVKIPKKLTGSVNGLIIMDSLGGMPLALRYTDTGNQWQEFAAYRIAPANGSMVVTFAMSGIGDVYLDDLGVYPVVAKPPAPATPQQSVPAGTFPNWLPNFFPK